MAGNVVSHFRVAEYTAIHVRVSVEMDTRVTRFAPSDRRHDGTGDGYSARTISILSRRSVLIGATRLSE